jgi:CelD/BcsL family acetyltransferase involved in cellulose biosynthesis
VTVWSGETLVGLLPMYVYVDQVSGERQLLMVGAGTSDYLDGVFREGCSTEWILGAIEAMCAEGGWDVGHFTQLRAESPLRRVLGAMGEERARPYPGEQCSECPAVGIAELPSKVRANVRYYRNYAIGRGALDLTVADAGNWSESFDLLVRFHTERWEGAGEAGVLADPLVLAWHRKAMPPMLASDLLRLYRLHLDGEVIAVLYAMVDPVGRAGRTVYLYLMGHSQEHAELRPGTLLTAMAMESAAAEGVRTVDMLRGEEVYKQFWRVKRVPTYGFALRGGA